MSTVDNQTADSSSSIASDAALNPALVESGDSLAQQTLKTKPQPHQNLQLSVRRVMNYRTLAKSFMYMQQFAQISDGNYPAKINCVLFAVAKPTFVFFPCQHMCVCNKCITSNDMIPDNFMDSERCVCPVCKIYIRIILPHTGNEEERYWPRILPPPPFRLHGKFKNVGKKLSEDSVAEGRVSTIGSISTQSSTEVTTPSQRTTRLYRGNIWTPSLAKRASAYKCTRKSCDSRQRRLSAQGRNFDKYTASKLGINEHDIFSESEELLDHFSLSTRSFISTSMPRKSVTPATVVPTASDDHNETLSDNRDNTHGHVVNTQEQMTTTHDVLTENSAADENIHNTNVDQNVIETVESAPTVADTRTSQQRPISPMLGSLPVSQSLRMNVTLTHRGSFTLVNNYKALATSFRQLQPFARRPDGTYPPSTLCIMCSTAKPTSVFFPCQHMCVCNSCIESNDMSPNCSMHLERCVCPVCSADIGLILPHTGYEEDAYWTWALNSKSSLPAQFTKDFKNAGKKIGDISPDKNGSIPTRRSSDTDKHKDAPMSKLRRSFSVTTKRRSAYEVETTKQQENCLIL